VAKELLYQVGLAWKVATYWWLTVTLLQTEKNKKKNDPHYWIF
jgi:hypothetical protein